MICFRLQDIYIICLFKFRSVGLFVIIGFVFNVRLHSILANILMDLFGLLENILGNWRSSNGLLLGAYSQF